MKNKNFLEKNAFYLYFLINLFQETRRNIKYIRKFYSNCNRKEFLKFDYELLKQNKRSDTLFILGSGASINKISDSMWKHIKENDSLGFNFWILHKHVPNYYMFEPPIKSNQELLLNLIRQKANDYIKNNTFFIMKDVKSLKIKCEKIPKEIRNRFMAAPKDDFYGNTKEIFIKSIRLAKKLNLLKRNVFYSRRASLFSAIYIGWRLGYKKIILAGIDLNNTDYFYDDSNKYDQSLVPVNPKRGKIHATAKDIETDFRIDELVYMIKEELLDKDNVELFVLNEKSLLAKKLPIYKEI